MMSENISEHRSQRIINQRYVRRCSFCRSPGHNITSCNSDRVTEFEVICASEVRNINNPFDFKNWLHTNYSETPMLLKTFVIKKFGVTTRVNVSRCIDMITDYIFRTYKNNTRIHTREQTLMNDLRDIHNTDTENFENDLINFLTQLRNVNYREEIEPQFHETPNIERMIMRELFLHIYNNNNVNREQETENVKFNINLIHNNADENKNDNTNNKTLENNIMCNICWDEKEQNKFIKFGCNHEFCKDCVITSFRGEQRKQPCCALCRSEITTLTYTNEDIRSELDEFVI
jgi:hypothetical protein